MIFPFYFPSVAKKIIEKLSTKEDQNDYQDDQEEDNDEEDDDVEYDDEPPPPTISGVKQQDSLCQIKELPTGCHDLKRLGHTLDGFYLIRSDKGVNKIDTVYCDFGNFSGALPITGDPLGGVTAGSTRGLIYFCRNDCVK